MAYRRTCDECGYLYEYETRPKGGECYCSSYCQLKAKVKSPGTRDRYGNKLEKVELSDTIDVSTSAIKRKAQAIAKKIDALHLEAMTVMVYLEDNDRRMASTHFRAVCIGLKKAQAAVELIA